MWITDPKRPVTNGSFAASEPQLLNDVTCRRWARKLRAQFRTGIRVTCDLNDSTTEASDPTALTNSSKNFTLSRLYFTDGNPLTMDWHVKYLRGFDSLTVVRDGTR